VDFLPEPDVAVVVHILALLLPNRPAPILTCVTEADAKSHRCRDEPLPQSEEDPTSQAELLAPI